LALINIEKACQHKLTGFFILIRVEIRQPQKKIHEMKNSSSHGLFHYF